MCSGVSIGYFLFVESANSTSPYSRSPSLGLTSSRRSIFGDIEASSCPLNALRVDPACSVPPDKNIQASRELPRRLSQVPNERRSADWEVVAYSSAQVMRVTTLRPSSVLSTVIVSDPVSPLGTAGRDVGEKKPSDAARDC